MSGSNGVPRDALWNRENEFSAPNSLKVRGPTFFTVQPSTVASTATLTPDQAMMDIAVSGAGGGTLTWPSSASILANVSVNSLQQNYLVSSLSGWSVTLINPTTAAETLSFPSNFVVSSSFSLTLPASSSRIVHFLILGAPPTQSINVY